MTAVLAGACALVVTATAGALVVGLRSRSAAHKLRRPR